MRAAVLSHNRLALDRAHPDPSPDAGEACLELALAAVSPGELTAGDEGRGAPRVPGWCAIGRVIDAKPANAGERAIVSSIGDGRAVCEPMRRKAGVDGAPGAGLRAAAALGTPARPGVLAERWIAPIASLAPVPDGVEDAAAAVAPLLARAIGAVHRAAAAPDAFVTVLGDDALAMLTLQAAAPVHEHVRLICREDRSVEFASRLGIRSRPIADIGFRADQQAVLTAPSMLGVALALAQRRGVVVLSGDAHRVELEPADAERLVAMELDVRGSSATPLSEALNMLEIGSVDVSSLIGPRLPLDEVDRLPEEFLRTHAMLALIEP